MAIVDSYTLLGSWPHAEVDLSVEALAAGMQARGVGRSLITHTNSIFYDSALGNDQVIALCAQHAPLTPVAVINPLRYPNCLREIERCTEQGVQVFRLCPREHGYPFSGCVGPLREVLRALEPARLVLVDLVGLSAPLLTADICELLPVPTAISVEASALGTVLQAGRHSPNVWAETSALTAGGAIEAAVEHLTPQRVVFGSRSPLRSIGSAVMSVQFAELTEADRLSVFEGNLQRVLS